MQEWGKYGELISFYCFKPHLFAFSRDCNEMRDDVILMLCCRQSVSYKTKVTCPHVTFYITNGRSG